MFVDGESTKSTIEGESTVTTSNKNFLEYQDFSFCYQDITKPLSPNLSSFLTELSELYKILLFFIKEAQSGAITLRQIADVRPRMVRLNRTHVGGPKSK